MSTAVPNNPSEGTSLPSILIPNRKTQTRRSLQFEREQAIIRRLETDDVYVERAVLGLYRLQTPVERRARTSTIRNGVGFSKPDALIFAGCGETLDRGGHLSEEQLRICRSPMRNGTPRIAKYRGQLIEMDNELLDDSEREVCRVSLDGAESEVIQ